MSDKHRRGKNYGTPNVKVKRKGKDETVKPALLLFGKDVSAQDIADAINAESKRQLETGSIGRRMASVKKDR
jgi:hypothetical protein